LRFEPARAKRTSSSVRVAGASGVKNRSPGTLRRSERLKVRYATKDHIFSQSDHRRRQIGGAAWVVACKTCNHRRGDRTIEGEKAGSWEHTDVVPVIIAELENRYIVPSAILDQVFHLISTMGTDVPDFMDDVLLYFRRQAMREERGWL
jgi:hypothetical protein